jgi:Zn finger protein HypA/HybF involved in hydrogenase expression
MSASAQDLLVRGIAAAKAKDIDEARSYLEWVLRTDANRQQRIKAWWWLSEISDNPAEKRDLLENILAHEPGHAEARRSLAILDGRLDPTDIIDSSRLSTAPKKLKKIRRIRTRQFTCPHCNGQMEFSPDGQTLLCPHCQRQMNLVEALKAGDRVEEQDFVVALATAKGHTPAKITQVFQCQGCGASFVVDPAVLSMNCPYCASAHVMERPEERELIPPEGIIPFDLTQEQAHHALLQWLKVKKLYDEAQTATPTGLYIPVWTFDVGGEIQWRERAIETRHTRIKTVTQMSSMPIFFDDILVPASQKFIKMAGEFKHYQLNALEPYESGYLATWPAETYQVSTADASLQARQQAFERAKQQAQALASVRFADSEGIVFSSAGITVESFKLIFLPIWLTFYRYQDKQYNVFINGQTGRIKGEKPRSKMRYLWDKFWGNE